MSPLHRFAVAVLALMFATLVGRAEPPPVKPPPTLAQALAALPPRAVAPGSRVLAVPSEYASPAAETSSAPTTLEGVADEYGLTLQTFGHVLALAPPTMTVLNTRPETLALSPSRIPREQALKILMGTLTAAQMRQLGTNGLGAGDLSGEQRMFFQAALVRPLQIVPMSARFDFKARQPYEAQTKKLTPEMMAGARLHANMQASYSLNIPSGSLGFFAWRADSKTPDPLPYKLSSVSERTPDRNAPTDVKQEQPNALKASDLSLTADKLRVGVGLDGVKTVGELTEKIAAATHLELHCDPHYAARKIMVLGDTEAKQPATAGDLLRALDLCLTATWRQVGPAYVLTDDTAGVATRRQRIKNVVTGWNARLTRLLREAGKMLAERRWWENLPFAPGDPGALSEATVRQVVGDPAKGSYRRDIPLGQLPPALQAELRARMTTAAARAGDREETYEEIHLDPTKKEPFYIFGPSHTITEREVYAKILDGLSDKQYKVAVELQSRLFLDVPHVGAVALDNGSGLFSMPSPRAFDEPPAPDKPFPPVPLTAAKRGLICAPKTASEARAIVDKMAAMGLNTLVCRVPLLPTDAADAGSVLAAAINEGKQKGVGVFAQLDTLRWRRDADASAKRRPLPVAEDVTVTGDGATDALAALPGSEGWAAVAWRRDGGAWVSPTDPAVQNALVALTRQTARIPGLAGLVFADTAAQGYRPAPPGFSESPIALGFTPANRLVFLRAHDADPLDLSDGRDQSLPVSAANEFGGFENNLDLMLSVFDAAPAADLFPAWHAFLLDADHALLVRLFAAAHDACPALPLLMVERSSGSVIIPWPDPKILPETDAHRPGSLELCPLDPARPDALAEWLHYRTLVEDRRKGVGVLFDAGAGDGMRGLKQVEGVLTPRPPSLKGKRESEGKALLNPSL